MKIVAWDAEDGPTACEEEQQPVTTCQSSNAITDAGTHSYIIVGLSCNVTDIRCFMWLPVRRHMAQSRWSAIGEASGSKPQINSPRQNRPISSDQKWESPRHQNSENASVPIWHPFGTHLARPHLASRLGSVLGWNPLDVVDCQCLDLRIAALQPQSQNFPNSEDE